MRRTFPRAIFVAVLFFTSAHCGVAQTAPAHAPKPSAGMSVNDVIRLSQAGLGDEIIIGQIQRRAQSFDLSTDDLLRLKAAKVSEAVIRAMIVGSTPAGAPPPPAPNVTPARTPAPSAVPTPRPLPVTAAAWTTHTDPAGFSVDTPAGWSVAADPHQGRVTLHGQRNEQVIVWPLFIEKRQLNNVGANVLLMQLARKIDDQLAWAPADASGKFVRAFAHGEQRSGATVMTWTNASGGATVLLFSVEAPSNLYRPLTDTFAGILKSFRTTQGPATPKSTGQGESGPVSFVNWVDPREHAFTMSVPSGWQVVGGAYRLTATDIRNGVTMLSPDGHIRVFVGDSSLGVYTEPTRMLAAGGLREGGAQMLGDGTKVKIARYAAGPQFVRAYVEKFIQAQCAGLQVESNNSNEALASTFLQSAQSENMPNAKLTAGDVTFTCTLQGAPVRGYAAAATIMPSPGRAPLWYVYRIFGYLAPAEDQHSAENVSQQAVRSWHINPEWMAQEQQIANSAVQQDNARSQQIQARARQAIEDDQRQTSDMIVKGYEQRSKVYDEISRKRENSILGTVDVVDPTTGAQYKVDNYSDYHWMSNSGYIAGTSTDSSPGAGWHEMVTLP